MCFIGLTMNSSYSLVKSSQFKSSHAECNLLSSRLKGEVPCYTYTHNKSHYLPICTLASGLDLRCCIPTNSLEIVDDMIIVHIRSSSAARDGTH